MNKFTILFLTLFLALPIAMKADSAKEKKDDSRYLVGAVPEVDGKVIFSKEFQIPGMSQAQIYDTVMKTKDPLPVSEKSGPYSVPALFH